MACLVPVCLATVCLATVCLATACSSSAPPPVAAGVVGAPVPGGLPVGSGVHTLDVGGRARSFRVYRPASLPVGARVPLVVMMHGGGGSAAGAERRYGWDPQADRDGFVVAYPEGVQHAWNDGGALESGVDDVGFLTGMIASIEATVPIDPARVYATGISEGGIMSYRLACSTDVLAAIGPDSATELVACPDPDPISVIHIHGTADTRIPLDGRPGIGVHHITGGSMPAVVDRWRAIDRCAPPVSTSSGPVHTVASTCPDGRGVTLITVDGAGHQWPGGAPAPASSRERRIPVDAPSPALDATDIIWSFFAAHPRA